MTNTSTLEKIRSGRRPAVTAHRGASFELPENTVPAMERAVEAGADFIEFDLRSTAEAIPVLLHDPTIDRTSDGSGRPEEYSLAELRKFNFSFFRHGRRLESPCFDRLEIPTFEEILERFRGRVCMNIQLYTRGAALAEVCRLYRSFRMKESGYLTVTPDLAEEVRKIAPEAELCITPGWKERATPEMLQFCRDAGCRFVQPIREFSTPETFRICRELGLFANVFFTDDPAGMTALAEAGADGVMTNRAELLCRAREKPGTTDLP